MLFSVTDVFLFKLKIIIYDYQNCTNVLWLKNRETAKLMGTFLIVKITKCNREDCPDGMWSAVAEGLLAWHISRMCLARHGSRLWANPVHWTGRWNRFGGHVLTIFGQVQLGRTGGNLRRTNFVTNFKIRTSFNTSRCVISLMQTTQNEVDRPPPPPHTPHTRPTKTMKNKKP